VSTIVDRACGAGEVKHIVHFAGIEGGVDVELAELKARFPAKMIEIRQTAGQEIVDG
jgi:hypothetical protein